MWLVCCSLTVLVLLEVEVMRELGSGRGCGLPKGTLPVKWHCQDGARLPPFPFRLRPVRLGAVGPSDPPPLGPCACLWGGGTSQQQGQEPQVGEMLRAS